MNLIEKILLFTRADSIGSIIARAIIWLTVVLILAAGIDNGKSHTSIKADAGWFFIFIFTIGLASYLLFGFVITF